MRIPIAAIPCEILPSRDFYDYEDKYLLDPAQTVLPADLHAGTDRRRCAVWPSNVIAPSSAKAWRRVDFLLEIATGKFYINEINTIPGFTSISMFPKMWEYSGLPMPKLIDRLIELAWSAHEAKKSSPLHPR